MQSGTAINVINIKITLEITGQQFKTRSGAVRENELAGLPKCEADI